MSGVYPVAEESEIVECGPGCATGAGGLGRCGGEIRLPEPERTTTGGNIIISIINLVSSGLAFIV